MTNTSQQIGASIGTALLNTIAAMATATYLAAHLSGSNLVAKATVHGFAVASGWAAGIFVLAAIVGGILITANPGQDAPRSADPIAAPNGQVVAQESTVHSQAVT
jgi:CBS domain containing-hemolysin-like protein